MRTIKLIIGITNNDNENLLLSSDGFTAAGKPIANFCKEVYGISKGFDDKNCIISPYFGAYNAVELTESQWKEKKDMIGNLDIIILHEEDAKFETAHKWLFQKKTRIKADK